MGVNLGFGSYYNDLRTTAEHFIISEVNTDFLKYHNINMTVAKFKELVRKQEPDFTTLCGRDFGTCKRVNVYHIKKIKLPTKE